MDVIRQVIKRAPGRAALASSTLAHLDSEWETARTACLSAARKQLSRVSCRSLRLQLDEAAARVRRGDAAGLTRELLVEIRRRVRGFLAAVDRAGALYSVEPLHAVRLAAKKLRYTLELAGPLLEGKARRATRRLKRLQEALGDMRDAQMAQQYLRRGSAEAPNRLSGIELAALDRDLEIECRRLHARILRARPRVERALRDVDEAAGVELLPKKTARAARMRPDRPPRREAVGQ
jgi:CHAD domain-containing protein